MGEQGLKDELKQAGVIVVNEEASSEDPSMSSDEFASMQLDPEVKAVIVGINYDFSYRTLCLATLYLQLNNAKFIATNTDRVFPSRVPGRKCPAGGSIVEAIAS